VSDSRILVFLSRVPLRRPASASRSFLRFSIWSSSCRADIRALPLALLPVLCVGMGLVVPRDLRADGASSSSLESSCGAAAYVPLNAADLRVGLDRDSLVFAPSSRESLGDSGRASLSPRRAAVVGFVSLCEETRRSFVADSAELREPNWASKPGSSPPRFLGVMGWGEPSVMRGCSTMVARCEALCHGIRGHGEKGGGNGGGASQAGSIAIGGGSRE
jgi:hypothetical protein